MYMFWVYFHTSIHWLHVIYLTSISKSDSISTSFSLLLKQKRHVENGTPFFSLPPPPLLGKLGFSDWLWRNIYDYGYRIWAAGKDSLRGRREGRRCNKTKDIFNRQPPSVKENGGHAGSILGRHLCVHPSLNFAWPCEFVNVLKDTKLHCWRGNSIAPRGVTKKAMTSNTYEWDI